MTHDARGRTLQVVATAANAAEAELIRGRLAEAGVASVSQRSIGGPEWGPSGGQYVYVEATHLDRAREILSDAEGLSDEELADLSEQAFRDATKKPTP
jgi:hypothetical protein